MKLTKRSPITPGVSISFINKHPRRRFESATVLVENTLDHTYRFSREMERCVGYVSQHEYPHFVPETIQQKVINIMVMTVPVSGQGSGVWMAYYFGSL